MPSVYSIGSLLNCEENVAFTVMPNAKVEVINPILYQGRDADPNEEQIKESEVND